MDALELRCKVCGEPLEPPARGPLPEYCPGSRCRTRAYRMRKAGVELNSPPFGSVIPARIPPKLPKPTADDIAPLFLAAKQLSSGFRQASVRAVDIRLRPMCQRMADAIDSALEEVSR